MQKHFYSDIIDIQIIEVELRKLDLSPKELDHLLAIAHETMHHRILDAILSELDEHDKKVFLMYLIDYSPEEVLEHVVKKVDKAHEKIKHIAKEFTKEMLEEIHDLLENEE